MPFRSTSAPTPAGQLPANVLEALARGRAIEAIGLLRDSTGISLKEAKDVIDEHLRDNPVPVVPTYSIPALPPPVVEALQQGNKIQAIRLLRARTGLGLKEAKAAVEAIEQVTAVKASKFSPGEVPRSSHVGLWIVVITAICVAAYYYFLHSSNT
jgi:ribosomal protein L7/L12